jgi:hypothetical protein
MSIYFLIKSISLSVIEEYHVLVTVIIMLILSVNIGFHLFIFVMQNFHNFCMMLGSVRMEKSLASLNLEEWQPLQ